VRLTALGDERYRAEVYFLPKGQLAHDYDIAFWVETPDSILTPDRQPSFPYDFTPPRPTSQWTPGELHVGLQYFTFHWPVSAVSIGMYLEQEGRVQPARLAGTNAARERIPVSVVPAGN
jgi:hypothetical protein